MEVCIGKFKNKFKNRSRAFLDFFRSSSESEPEGLKISRTGRELSAGSSAHNSLSQKFLSHCIIRKYGTALGYENARAVTWPSRPQTMRTWFLRAVSHRVI
jgi:hypothetical protein